MFPYLDYERSRRPIGFTILFRFNGLFVDRKSGTDGILKM